MVLGEYGKGYNLGMQNGARVGLLVTVFAALLVAGYAVLGRQFMASPNDLYYAEMPDAGGVAAGAKALMAGVEVGKVQKIILKDARTARLTLELNRGVKIPSGSQVVIPGSLISFGMPPIEIVPPAGGNGGFLPVGAVMPGKKASPLDALLPNAKGAMGDVQTTLAELNKTLVGAQKWLNDDKLRGGLTSLLESSQAAVEKMTKAVDGLVADNRPYLNDIVKTLAKTTKEINTGTKLVVDLIEKGEFQKEGLDLLKKFNQSADTANKLLASVDSLVSDPSLKQSLGASLENVKDITDSGAKIAASGEQIAANTATVSEKAIGLADQAGELLTDVRSAVQSVNAFLNRAKSSSGGFPKIQTSMDLSHDSGSDRFQTDFMFQVPFAGNIYRLGIFDAFEGDKLTAQIGREYKPGSAYFYGVYAGKPGLGVSSQIAPRLSLTSDFFDLNRPRLDVRVRYDFGGGVNGWVGINRMFGQNSPAIGIGIRR